MIPIALVLFGWIFSIEGLTPVPPKLRSPCAIERVAAEAGNMHAPGGTVALPQCTRGGYYNATQCSAFSGYCWCVFPENGRKLEGMEVPPAERRPPSCPKCLVDQAQALPTPGAVDGYVPQCDAKGNYVVLQVDESTGWHFCMDPNTCQEVPNTRAPPTAQVTSDHCTIRETGRTQAPPTTPTAAHSPGPCTPPPPGSQSPPGSSPPKCTANGMYEEKQCNPSTGYCWCVDPQTGSSTTATPTRSSTQQSPGPCTPPPPGSQSPPGTFHPQCSANGQYQPRQCNPSTGHCWCVDPRSGQEIASTNKAPGQGQPNCGGAGPSTTVATTVPTTAGSTTAATTTRAGPTEPAPPCKPAPAPPPNSPPLVGSFNPKCSSSGRYEPRQCNPSTGHCWCVDPQTSK